MVKLDEAAGPAVSRASPLALVSPVGTAAWHVVCTDLFSVGFVAFTRVSQTEQQP